MIGACLATDWRNPTVIDMYNDIVEKVCRKFNITFIDFREIMSPLYDRATDWCHYRDIMVPLQRYQFRLWEPLHSWQNLSLECVAVMIETAFIHTYVAETDKSIPSVFEFWIRVHQKLWSFFCGKYSDEILKTPGGDKERLKSINKSNCISLKNIRERR